MPNLKPIARWREPGEQQVIWPWVGNIVFESANHVSPYLGDFAEEYVARSAGGHRLITDSRALCPDIEINKKWYMEVKAIGPRGCFIMYRQRYEKYKRMAQHTKLTFVLVCHDVEAAQLKNKDLNQLKAAMSVGINHVISIPSKTLFHEIERIVAEKGWGFAPGRKEAYQDYVRISPAWIDKFRTTKPHRVKRIFPIKIYGEEIWYTPLRAYKIPWPETAKVGVHPKDIRQAAWFMAEELKGSWHQVELFPGHSGIMRRVVTGRNVRWYERMRRDHYTDNIRGYSLIKRGTVLNCLKAMAANKPVAASVEVRLWPYIMRWIEENEATRGEELKCVG